MSEHEYPALSNAEPSDRCKRKIAGIEPVVSVRVEGGYASRCLLCAAVGPVMGSGEASRRMLLNSQNTP